MFFTTMFILGLLWLLAAILAGIGAAIVVAPAMGDEDLELVDFENWHSLEDVKEAWLVVWDYREVFYPAFTFFFVGLPLVTTAFINSPYA